MSAITERWIIVIPNYTTELVPKGYTLKQAEQLLFSLLVKAGTAYWGEVKKVWFNDGN